MPTLYDNFSQVRQYIDENNTSYVSKTELANASYVTSSQLSDCSYATTSYVADYVATYGGGVIDENIIPKENNTYTLGNSTYRYHTVYSENFMTRNNCSIHSLSDYNIYFKINGADRWHFDTLTLIGKDNKVSSLGTSASQFLNTYTSNLYTDTAYLNDTSYTKSIIPSENNTYTLGDSSYLYAATYTSRVKVGNNSQMYNDGGGITFSVNNNNGIRIGGSTFYPKTSGGYSNGSSTNLWSNTYTRSVNYGTGARIFSESSATSEDLAIELGGVSYFYINNNRFAPNGSANSGTIDLGTSDRKWNGVYCNDLYLGSQHIKQDEYSIGFQINGNNTMRMFVGSFRPWTDKGATLGSSTTRWSTTYTSNIYADTAYISDYHNFIWTGTSAEYLSLSDYTTYQFYLVQES